MDIVNAVAADLGWTTTHLPPVPLADYPAGIAAGAFDVYAGNITITAEREAQSRLSIPFSLNTGEAIYVLRSDTTDYRSIQDLRGRVVGTLSGGNGLRNLESLGAGFFAEIRTYPGTVEVAEAVIRGEIDAGVLGTGITARYILAQGAYPELHIPANYRGTFSVGGVHALPLGPDVDVDMFNRSLAKLMTNGTITAIFANYGLPWPYPQ